MKTKTLRQTVTFIASPKKVYEALMDSKQHAAFTGAKASISQKIGGKISAWDGYISGKNLELITNKKIVQQWRASDWPKDIFSTVSFTLSKVPKGTKLTFVQTELPEDFFEDIKQGWIDHYWDLMKLYFKK